MIYLDNHATTPLAPEVLEAMAPFQTTHFHNPSASYRAGRVVREAVEKARQQVAELIGAQPGEIVLTSGGTEGNNAALKWLARVVGRKGGLAVTTAIEHSAVLRPFETFREVGFATRLLGVDGEGRVELAELEEALEWEGPGFLSAMLANNETGVIQPVAEMVERARQRGWPVHSDAVQAVGKMPLQVGELGVDFLTLSGHKFHGPKGVGALYVRSGVAFEPLLRGGGQEGGRRSGTENVAGIVGLGAAAELARRTLEAGGMEEVQRWRDDFEVELQKALPEVCFNGAREGRLPTVSHLSLPGCEGAALLILLDERGVQVSTGSACMAGKNEASHVQLAMGMSRELSRSSLRISFSRQNEAAQIPQVVRAVCESVERFRAVQGGGEIGPVVVYGARVSES